ncbi:MAG: nucleoside triphosphate pyrophosphohydrolase [Pseudohongiellaceae bacterium]
MTASNEQQADPGNDQYAAKPAVEKLLMVMKMLRDRQSGCPWDLEQSIASLVPYTLEEVYEVVDAIEKNDMVELEDELGDLLFQVVFYAQIANENGYFDFDAIATAITRKLVRRHPHVFPDGDVMKFGQESDISSDQVAVNWEIIKKQEREEKQARRGTQEQAEQPSVLDDVPRALPAMERAKKLQKRAASHGFDWSDMEPVVAKLREEVAELEEALAGDSKERVEAELGDVLFAAINLARHASIEPEAALRGTNKRFESRFRWIESRLTEQGKSLDQTGLDELDRLWNEAKQQGL